MLLTCITQESNLMALRLPAKSVLLLSHKVYGQQEAPASHEMSLGGAGVRALHDCCSSLFMR